MDSNKLTLQAYEDNIQKFIERTPKDTIGDTKDWLDAIAKRVEPKSTVFEIGSGFGRDAEYLRRLGIKNIVCSDGAAGFVNVLQENGFEAILFNVVTEDFLDKYDLIFADAVFEHLTEDQLDDTFLKIYRALNMNGVLAFSVRQGDGETFSTEKLDTERYFKKWQPGQLHEKLNAIGYRVDSTVESVGYQDIKRLYLIATKIHE